MEKLRALREKGRRGGRREGTKYRKDGEETRECGRIDEITLAKPGGRDESGWIWTGENQADQDDTRWEEEVRMEMPRNGENEVG